MVPLLPLFWFASRSGLGLCPSDCCRVPWQRGCPGSFQAIITSHERPPERIAYDALPPLYIPVQEIGLASPR